MKKLLTTIAINIIMYILPLLGRPSALFSVQVIILMISSTILLLSQPAISANEAKAKRQSDRYSIYIIMVCAMIGQIVALVDWAYRLDGSSPATALSVIGGIMLMGGIVFRVYSIRYLGKYFTSVVQITHQHKLIKSGPYRIVRHPSYLGSFLAIVGSAIFLGSAVGAIVSVIAMTIAYKVRITVEEEALARAFGDEYRDYRQKTFRVIPCVW